MKKARMIISAALVFAVVGTALAFKPANLGDSFCVKADISSTGTCDANPISGQEVGVGLGTQYFVTQNRHNTNCSNRTCDQLTQIGGE